MPKNRERLDDFAARLEEASKRGASRVELAQTIVDTATECVGAMSAACYERRPDGSLLRIATAGLFPPLRPLDGVALEKFSTRARLIEHVFHAEEIVAGDSVAGRVAAAGHGELVADAVIDPRIPHHADPALTVRSIIFVPLMLRGEVHGVLVFANPVADSPFTSEDFLLAESLAGLAATALLATEPPSAKVP